MDEKKISLISASPKVRKFARELGADLQLIKGSQREGRIIESDVRTFIKQSLSKKTEPLLEPPHGGRDKPTHTQTKNRLPPMGNHITNTCTIVYKRSAAWAKPQK